MKTLQDQTTSKTIPVGRGKWATVDAEDYPLLKRYDWRLSAWGYAMRSDTFRPGGHKSLTRKRQSTIYMHRSIMHAPEGMQVDHINGDVLDNRKCNLRICTEAQNHLNKGSKRGKSKYTGVYQSRRKWVSHIWVDGKSIHLGSFESEEQAARAWDKKAFETRGEFARLNFPSEVQL